MSAVALIGSLEGSGTFTLESGRVARLDPKAFEAVIRAVDQGLPIESNRLRDRTDSALASGALAIPRAEGAITIAAGQARLSNSMAGERGSELALNARVNLAESDIDARLVLSSAAAAGALANAPPEIVVALKGPVSAPRRSIDVAAFASWLALRAVEQQSKKLDVLEGRETSVPITGAADEKRPPERAATQGTQADRPGVPNTAPLGQEASRPPPPVRSVQRPKPAETANPPPPADSIPRQLLFGVQ
jgi:large subunit ribosomal protein L24